MNFYFPDLLDKEKYGCEKCGLNKDKINFTTNDAHEGILIIGDTPTKKDSQERKHLYSEIVQPLKTALAKNKIYPNKVAYGNVTLCSGGKITEVNARCCRQYIEQEIKKIKPKIIISLGTIASNILINSTEKHTIHALRNRIIPSYEFNCMIFPTFHPKELKNPETNKIDYDMKFAFDKDISRILKLFKLFYSKKSNLNRILKERKILDNVKITYLKTKNDLDKAINKCISNGKFAFDYETTNTKPFDYFHEVWEVSLGIEKEAFVAYLPKFDNKRQRPDKLIKDQKFHQFEDEEYLKERIYDLLQNKNIKKIIHNEKFEELVSRHWLNKPEKTIINNSFCTLLANHVVDCRGKTKSLNFLNQVKFGIPPYDKKVKHLLRFKNKTDTQNRIHLISPKDLIEYGGLDVLTTYHQEEAVQKQLKEVEKFPAVYKLLYEGGKVCADIEENGFPIDLDKLVEIEDMLNEEVNKILDKIKDIKEVKQYLKKSKIVYKKDDPFLKFLNSPKQLQDFLYNFCKLNPVKNTKTGYSTDEEVINTHAEKDNNEFCKLMVKIRKLNKAIGTYIAMFTNNLNEDGKIHCSILLYGTETGRSSITDPSLQTIPKHENIIDDIPWTILRNVFIPSSGNILGQVDYSGFELSVGAAISGDSKFINDVNTIDLHAKYGGLIFEINKPLDIIKRDHKDERFHGKNSMVFASVYGAVPYSIAQNLRNVDLFIEFGKRKYKKSKSKLDFNDWFVSWSEEHIKNIQDLFFTDYSGLKAFQESSVQKYYEVGYVELPIGFRRYYPLNRNKIINTPTQGMAFLLLLDALVKVNKEMKDNKFESKIILETHDDMTFDVIPEEAKDLKELVDSIVLNPDFDFMKKCILRNEWTWGINFKEMKEYKSGLPEFL